jgi:hypothetical protein
MPLDADDVVNLGWQELRLLAARMTIERPGEPQELIVLSEKERPNGAHSG